MWIYVPEFLIPFYPLKEKPENF